MFSDRIAQCIEDKQQRYLLKSLQLKLIASQEVEFTDEDLEDWIEERVN